MLKATLTPARTVRNWLRLPSTAKSEAKRDYFGLTESVPDLERALREAIGWLSRAQDHSRSHDGGVARHYGIIDGWSTSYPETTGYIVPTMLDYARWRGDEEMRRRGFRMLDWLVSIQLADGGFQGGRVDSKPVVPVTFNTGQILIGLAAGAARDPGRYGTAMCRAADWLTDTIDRDGCWRKFPTPFSQPGEKAYETHVAWGLLEAARVAGNASYADTALANVRWALRWQTPNGWVDRCCLTDPNQPLTHTLGYALRGIIEAYRYSGDRQFLESARRTAEGIMSAVGPDGFLPGRLRSDWTPAVTWACLTGTAQIAHCWLQLFEITSDSRYLEAGVRANEYVRRTVTVDGPDWKRGAVKGSFPIYGGYGRFEFLSWATKFFIDSHMLERHVAGQTKPQVSPKPASRD